MMIDSSHLTSNLHIAVACLEISSRLPQTDIIVEMHDLLLELFDINHCILQGKHYGSQQLEDLNAKCETIIAQLKTIKEIT